ncbi:aminopeptidase N [Streptomyces sp. KhCrAH-43]|uniref:aminopeptidase N n=1 Tax=unclassified Streptomyces TaxID=2593676 RepID=UPI00035C26E0|nr:MULTISPECIES: aminopeptidase N [unclassified Streptomyces]MYS35359.1 aminopeptidase N [Streptomyces sp. SID4920]RAJ65169.1 aminopeptidase N [Streptomyces sp. KhCrAH-43]
MSVLTRDEAQARAQILDVQRYTVELDLTAGEETFDSRTRIEFTVREAGDSFLELKPATLRSISLDGQPLDPADLTGNRFPLHGLTTGPHELRVDAAMHYSRTGEGMHRFTDPSDNETYVYTQLFMEDVQRVFAAFDQPDLKAVFALTVTAPEGWTVLGNGIAEHTGEGRWTIAPTPPVSTYLVAVAAGPWHSVTTEHAGLPFGIHCRRSLAPHLDADADEILGITRACFDRFQEKFDEPYPFDSYDQAFVPEFNAGAMENPGLVTFRDEFVYRSAVTDTERQTRGMVIAHEMAHMWFGDLVTLAWWDDIWLNESFAEYMGYQTLAEATAFTDTWTEFGVTRKGWGYDADQRPSTHPVAPDPADVPDTASALLNFDGISYSKGASALRQLVAWLGEKDFLTGINNHFARHKFGNATLADFIDNLASATDRDVHAWAAQWLRTTGIDTLTAHTAETDTTWSLTVGHHGTRPHRISVGVYDHSLDTQHGPTPLVLRERFTTGVPEDAPAVRPGPRPALVVINDEDLTYAKIRLDPTSWNTVLDSLSGIPEALTRAVVWNAARDMVRDGELAPSTYLESARAHLPYETDLALLQGVLAFAGRQVAGRYTAPEDRPAALATLTALCRDLIRRTEDGTNPGLRLTAVRHLIDAATQPDTIQGWLTDDTVPGGPELDPELRWRILTRLAVLGATDEAAIAAALEDDPSATGQEGAARCRAALPDPEAKAAAWDAMFHDDSLSNYLFTATAQGFWQPEQTDLVRAYVPRYYPEAAQLAARRGPAIAEAAGSQAFPAHAVDADSLRLGEEALDDPGLTPALRRKLTDQIDDVRRALHVRDAN